MPSFLGKGNSNWMLIIVTSNTKDNRHESVDPIVALIVALLELLLNEPPSVRAAAYGLARDSRAPPRCP